MDNLNPFSNSTEKRILYYGSFGSRYKELKRPPSGIIVSPIKYWIRNTYTDLNNNPPEGFMVSLYADIKNMYVDSLSTDYSDPFYDKDLTKMASVVAELQAKGFDSYLFDKPTESIVLFNTVSIINSGTGRLL